MADPREAFKTDAARLALRVLVERLGGSVTITRDELEAMGRRYGGSQNLGVEIRHRGDELQLTLVTTRRCPPRQ